ncbi:hypothetical protein D5S17_05130 [Pseudonocardiaceae bacterium YIM PH 21723]|nr:hypothetical protein D5S17_05130 [Pseudonocardiaceae bacterium YIM PH 21723]
MRDWIVRGLSMAGAHALAQVLVAFILADWPETTWPGPIFLAILILVALGWGLLDRWDRGWTTSQSAVTWLIAGLVAGPIAGLLRVIAAAIFIDYTGTDAVWAAMVGGASFTALMVFLPAFAGQALGGLLPPRDRSQGAFVQLLRQRRVKSVPRG